MIDILMVVGGLILLFFGGEGLIRGAVSLARNFGLSKLLVSAVIVGFGTSMPEMTVSVGAALKGASDIAIGNVVGSNIANILLIVGLAAVLYPITIAGNSIKRDVFVMLGASLALCGLATMGMVSFFAGLIMFLALVAYIVWSYCQDKKVCSDVAHHIEEDVEGEPRLSRMTAAGFALGGLVLLIGGAYILVEGAVSIARGFGISEAVIGLTVVAVGTSLPELATAFIAAMRKHSDVVIGNILGSNIFNILSILGVTAIISPIPISSHIAAYDVWIMLGVSAFLSVYLLRGMTIGRISGAAMLVAYTAYTVWLYMNGTPT
ncbi:calcium/sodium antiporter [Micavibrio aeruginosavorus]|uniref:Inner membrane protein YrbG, predicted calcium/sodium:proton antiporter n=1 Tax=Micavibrio aeruginosavorus EPB TaxID=349215 RepID=M4VJP2_9BACT|nr:calcium/sodium antiporter [Micavibrio aeruginosavorus]AGH98715.1 Inner membrane protein YrbG, predicted calcium/sodium:proton antiporter [Micavibrio aeruginosavorus EPB]